MSIYTSHLNSAISILRSFSGNEPFHLYLKKHFLANKKFGSNDRRQIASLCYNYFRLGSAVDSLDIQEKILLGTFLCENKSSQLLQFFKPEWNNIIDTPLKDKLAICNMQLEIENIFSFKDELSEGIDSSRFNQSFLVQPKLFLRIRPGFNDVVIKKLEKASLQFEFIAENGIALPNSSKIDSIIELDKEAVVQDYSSQRFENLLKLSTINSQFSTKVWDCCAGSGGKSIMAFDVNPNIALTVSDKRKSILENLKARFKKAGIKNYHSFINDISSAEFENESQKYDLIIADVPCTGSGTWGRTPEQLYYFNSLQIQKYNELQKEIVKNAISALHPAGHFLYITCSVFKKENEEVVDFIKENFPLNLKKMELFKGYEFKADTMFAALFTAT